MDEFSALVSSFESSLGDIAAVKDVCRHGFNVVARTRPLDSFTVPELDSMDPLDRRTVRLELVTQSYRCHAVLHGDDSVAVPVLGEHLFTKTARGGAGSLIAFGQTGTGKTHTLNAVLRQLPAALFREGAILVTVSSVELRGTQAYDLLSLMSPVKILEDRTGEVHLRGASSHEASSAEELSSLLTQSMANRTVAGTERNEESSRSHAILRLSIRSGRKSLESKVGRLTLVDLAGSERGGERGHEVSSERLAEAVQINQSLMALKECMRSMTAGAASVPYRQSPLTMCLRDAFLFDDALTLFVACLSPLKRDLDHTKNTMMYMDYVMQREASRLQDADRPEHPQDWNKSQVSAFITEHSSLSAAAAFPLTGRQFCALSLGEFEARSGVGNEEIAHSLYGALQDTLAAADVVAATDRRGHGATRSTGLNYAEASLENFERCKTGNVDLEACREEAFEWPDALKGLRDASLTLLKKGKSQNKRQTTLLKECHGNAEEVYQGLCQSLTLLETTMLDLEVPMVGERSGLTEPFPPPPEWPELPKAQMGVKKSEEAFESYQTKLNGSEVDLDDLIQAGDACKKAWTEAHAAYVARSEACKRQETAFEKRRAELEEATKCAIDEARDKVDRHLECLAQESHSGAISLPLVVMDMVEEYEANKHAHEDLLRMMGR